MNSIDSLTKKATELQDSIRLFKAMFVALSPEHVELVDNEENKCVGTVIKRDGYEVYETILDEGFSTVNHLHKTANEYHTVIDGSISICMNSKITILSKDQMIYVPKNTYHVLRALKKSRLVSIVIPSLQLD